MIHSSDSLFIGVDGGGTGCRVRICDAAGTALAETRGGAANVTTNRDLALANITHALSELATQANIPPKTVHKAAIHLGLAGVMSREIAQQVAQALPFANITVTDDRPTNLVGALGGQDGFLIAVGTGSFLAAQRDGASSFLGGWGFYASDQASAAWLGRRALEEVLLCVDGLAPHSPLTSTLLAGFDDDPNQLVQFSARATPGAYGTLAPKIVAALAQNDPTASRLMQEGLAYLTKGLQRLGFQPGDRLCLTGGVGAHYASLFPPEVQTAITPPAGNALDGAIRLAMSRRAKPQHKDRP